MRFLPAGFVRRTANLFHRFRGDRCGNAAILFSIAVVPLAMAAGAAIDYTRLIAGRAALQQAVDAAVLAGVAAPAASRNAVAASTFNAALAQSNLAGVAQSWTTNGDGSFTGSATATTRLVMSTVMSLYAARISVTATGVATSSGPSAAKVCALVLDPSSAQALLVNSNVTVNAPTCEIDVASTGNPVAAFNSNDTFNVNRICLAGAQIIQNGGTVSPLQTGCATASNPFASALPSVTVGSCTVSNQTYSGPNTLSPGVYCGNFSFNGSGTLALQPGLYVLNGANWSLPAGWTLSGAGVTFHFANQNSYIQVNSGATMNVSAPSSGTYANILMFEPNGLPSSVFTVNGSAGHQLNGLIYLPSRNVTFSSQSNLNTEYFTLVVNQLVLDGLNWNVAAAPLAIAPARTAVASARLMR